VAEVQEGINLRRGIITNTSLLCKIFIFRMKCSFPHLTKVLFYTAPSLILFIESGSTYCWRIWKFYITCL